MITGIHHTGIWVSDAAQLLPFYRDVLGMKVVMTPEEMSGPLVEILTGIPGAKVRAVFLEINGQCWEFLQLVDPPSEPIPPDAPYAQVGRGHICFQTDNIEEIHEKLKEEGVEFLCPPQDVPEGKFFYFKDLEGNRVEMFQTKPIP